MDFTNIFLSNFYKDNDFFSHTRVGAPKSNDLERFRYIWATNGVFWVLKRGRNRKNKGNRTNKDIKGFKDIKDFKEFLGRHIPPPRVHIDREMCSLHQMPRKRR